MATIELDVSEATRMQTGFMALALSGDNAALASEQCGIPQSTLKRWRKEERAAYDAVRRDMAPRLEAVVIAEQYAFVLEAGRVKRLALAATEKAILEDQIPAKDLPRALQAITTSEAISTDKILALSGRPTSVVEHRSSAELMRRLASLGAIVDATATEIPNDS